MSGEISKPTQYLKDNLFIKCLQCSNDKIEMEEVVGIRDKGDNHICEACKAKYTLQHVMGLKLVELER